MASREKNVQPNQHDREKLLALEECLKNRPPDEQRASQVDQKPQVRLSATQLYIPATTKTWMDETAKAPIMAITTKTDEATSTVYFWRAAKPTRGDRKLRFTDTMGGANVGFAVPLRKLGLKFLESRRIILAVRCEQLPTMGPVFSVSFAEYKHEPREIDKQLAAASKQVETEVQKLRKVARLKRTLEKMPTASATPAQADYAGLPR